MFWILYLSQNLNQQTNKMKSLQRLVLSAFPLFLFSQNQVNPVPKERIDRYVEFAGKGEIVISKTRQGKVVSSTRTTVLDYHEDELALIYTQDEKSTSLSTVLKIESDFVRIMEHGNIDGIPEKVAFKILDESGYADYKNIDVGKRRILVNKYSQIINFVLDSLPLKK